ncbi:helix-turn-helix domain-containing protein [Micromonospora deserti]|uniref:HTH cro/C1-type domain-containing protein n=1 Tax=Micromonospora deserti TaxID=2070366 RepID=A0A2W2CFU9_9ACTN|nr:helix-turn-helix transcriptional regulator [Micromonospora deserti]PZF91854.1 hypothetical protein C1I99_22700 [Micromonospora deserti]
MAEGTNRDVGDRIAGARRQRGMSRKTLADLVGRSEEWLRQIENGHRRLDSIECAVRIAEVLHLGDLMTLLGLPARTGAKPSVHTALVAPVREAVMDCVAVNAFTQPDTWSEAAATLEADVAEAGRRWLGRAGRYGSTLQLLPRLLRGAAARLHATTDPVALQPAIAACLLARTVLSRMGEEQLAWLTADRALSAAARVTGPALPAAAWHVSSCYLEQGHHMEAYRFALGAAESATAGDSPETGNHRGALRLLAAEAAAALLEVDRAGELLSVARDAATGLADQPQPHLVPFNMTEVGMAAVQIAIHLGHGAEAIRLASEVDVPDAYPADRQARHYISLAHLHARRNEDAAAVFALGKVATLSPEDVRYDSLSREALHRLQRRNNLTVRRELAHLTRLAGMT